MKKAFLVLSVFCLAVVLAACTSAEAKELLEYHNGYVDNVVDKLDEVDKVIDKVIYAESDEEALEIQKNELLPLTEGVKKYMESQKPVSEEAKEYHALRADAFKLWYEAYQLNYNTSEKLVNGSISEDEAIELFDQLDDKFTQSEKLIEEGNNMIDELSDKHEFEENEEE